MKKKPNLLKDALLLCLITCVAGLLLGITHYVTKEPIAKAEERTKTTAYQSVCPAAVQFTDCFEELLGQADEILAASDHVDNTTIDGCLKGTDEQGNVVGYVVLSTCSKSYGGDISIVTGFDAEGIVTGVEVLSISDTPGLGMKAKDADFRQQFVGKNTDYYTVTKSGANAEDEIDAISSATITSRAFTNAENGAKAFLLECLKGGEE
jgi:electron transport complex protein RnfG